TKNLTPAGRRPAGQHLAEGIIMAIRFSCDCGQTITARSEYAGRKVQCVGCKKILVVPGGDKKGAPAAARPPAPPPEPVEAAPPPLEAEPDPEFAPTLRTPTPVLTPPATGLVRFRCACGADFQASGAHAGEPARCTRCGDVLFIPARSEPAAAGERPIKAS